MNRDLYTKHNFIRRDKGNGSLIIPKWLCPICNGHLQLDGKAFNFYETLSWINRTLVEHPDWIEEEMEYTFTGKINCPKCNYILTVNGRGKLIEDQIVLSTGVSYDNTHHRFWPLYFFPTLDLFQINNKCPKKVREEIIKAFNLFWCDLSSYANKIRNAVERLMDEKRIKKYHKPKGSRKEVILSLHQRLELFKAKQPEISDHLMAIKWLANVGSHAGEIKLNDALDGFELLEYCIEKLYDNRELKLKNLSKKINKRRGPVSG